MARAMDGHPRGMERWSGRRKRRGAEPTALEAASAAGGKQMYSDTGGERKFAIP